MFRYYKYFFIILIMCFWYFTTFLFGKGAYDYGQAERSFSARNVDGFLEYLSSNYLLKAEARISFANYVLNLLRENSAYKDDAGFQALFLFTLSELEKEARIFPRNLNVRILLVQYYALINDKEKMMRALNAALSLSPRREILLEFKKKIELFLNAQ